MNIISPRILQCKKRKYLLHLALVQAALKQRKETDKKQYHSDVIIISAQAKQQRAKYVIKEGGIVYWAMCNKI